jgi:hypothetical protein
LIQGLEAVMGKGNGSGIRSRRNTLEK